MAGRQGLGQKPGISGYFGVVWSDQRKKWVAQHKHEGATEFLGAFKDPEEAARAFDKRAKVLGKKHYNFGPGGLHEHGGRGQSGVSKTLHESGGFTVSSKDIASRARAALQGTAENDTGILPFNNGKGRAS